MSVDISPRGAEGRGAAGAVERRAVERRAVGWGVGARALASTLLRTWSRDPGVLIQAVVFPAFLLAMFQLVLGRITTAIGAGQSIYGYTGLVALVGAMFGTLMTGIYLVSERESGVLGRLWTLPIPRSSFLAGRVLAEMVRTLLGTVVLFAVAALMGFRFTQGWLAGIGAVLVPVVFGIGFVFVVIAIATVAQKSVVDHLGVLFLLMLFFNTGFAPISEYPGWLQPIVRYQPMSPAIDTMTGLTEGGPILVPFCLTLGWAAAFAVVFGVLSMRGYRRAVERGAS